jgi:ATP:cob(I)alamin adenosyltransferase
MKIYTRRGDGGLTGIRGGQRVAKDDVRIEANGALDELNAQIGVVRSLLPVWHEWQELLRIIQREIMAVMSHVATPSHLRDRNPHVLDSDLTTLCERLIDTMTAQMDDTAHFVLPGGVPAAAQLHLARTVARRAERRLWTLHRTDPLPDSVMPFVNRLSDLFFIMARHEMQRFNKPEERWQPFRGGKNPNP